MTSDDPPVQVPYTPVGAVICITEVRPHHHARNGHAVILSTCAPAPPLILWPPALTA
eukprot:CAMPEP_0204552578 /NCGR_PEP_ID=MMETSP0661-20131031/26702_1 /ASSEMBLY_ACC=CAM_ASM_000606 /TAXON_ID=109239 /ORGANISM="Alexandrium margalefi, Strain AMGDE01CS-322" /LENGTH=56 /DNA_ID=CAMNT_0051559595 /DNA_START=133 /DNA_END=300 /DNA_ORIENTATION=+